MLRHLGLISLLVLAACKEEEEAAPEVIRGMKAHLIEASATSSLRKFPAVLEPSELSALSFEVGGSLGVINLDVGQQVNQGDTVAELDKTSFILQVESAQASVEQAQAAASNAQETSERQATLLERGTTTRAAADDAKAQADQAKASLKQAEKALETAQQSLDKATLKAPVSGIINSVDVTSYATVAAGTSIVTMYSPDAFEVSFSVNFDVVNQLVVGKPAEIRLADRPDIVLPAVISEIGSRADAVSSFPIVLELTEGHALLKAGMAVEASIELPLPEREGFVVPLSAAIKDGKSGDPAGDPSEDKMGVFLYDPATQTVKRHEVVVGGIRENSLLIVEGLSPGDLVASAGVSFLKDGQKVKLLTSGDQ